MRFASARLTPSSATMVLIIRMDGGAAAGPARLPLGRSLIIVVFGPKSGPDSAFSAEIAARRLFRARSNASAALLSATSWLAARAALRLAERRSAMGLFGVPATRPPVLRPLATVAPGGAGEYDGVSHVEVSSRQVRGGVGVPAPSLPRTVPRMTGIGHARLFDAGPGLSLHTVRAIFGALQAIPRANRIAPGPAHKIAQ